MANDYIIKIEGSWPSGETEYVIGTEDPQRLPVVSSDDNGDVLTVVGGKWSDAAPGGGGSSLPTVTSDDNGDVLTVVEGEWAKAAPSGGGLVLVEASVDTQTMTITLQEKAGDLFALCKTKGVAIHAGMEGYGEYVRPILFATYIENSGYTFAIQEFTGNLEEEWLLLAETADDYPVYIGQ